jgi:hypothetical protein
MVDTYCAKASACVPASDRDERGADCEESLALRQDCDHAAVIFGPMSDCLKAIDAIDCGSYDPSKESPAWPDACFGIVSNEDI